MQIVSEISNNRLIESIMRIMRFHNRFRSDLQSKANLVDFFMENRKQIAFLSVNFKTIISIRLLIRICLKKYLLLSHY